MIARIIMSEHPNEKDLEHFSSDHKEAVKDGFLANTKFSIFDKTSPTSLLVISGYEDQKSADSNLEARQKWFDERKGKYLDTFYYEGEIKTQMKGGGKQLLSLALSKVSKPVRVTVLSNNLRAINLYKGLGFIVEKEQQGKIPLTNIEATSLRMVLNK